VTVQGTEGADNLSLLAVSRGLIINGLGGNDTLVGGTGIDSIAGGTGADRIEGADGSDSLTGDAGNDILLGNDGDDTLSGGADADTLTGGSGDDQLSGGAGADVFVFSTSLANNGVDVVAGFEVGAAGDDIDFAFGAGGEDFQDVLHGTGLLVQKLAAGGILDVNAGLALVTTPQIGLDALVARGLANGLQSLFEDGDVLFLAFDDGTDTGIFRVSDSVADEDTLFDEAELLVTLQGVTVGTLAPQNFVDFAPVQEPV
jgi:Ca2+-binding RTX toxin-like protein